MSIENFGGIYTLECDMCGEEATEDFDNFYDAVNWKKDKLNGWTSRKIEGNWSDLCPGCKESK